MHASDGIPLGGVARDSAVGRCSGVAPLLLVTTTTVPTERGGGEGANCQYFLDREGEGRQTETDRLTETDNTIEVS